MVMVLKNSWQLLGPHTNNSRPKDACVSAFYTVNSPWNSGLTPRATHKCLCPQNILSFLLFCAVGPFSPKQKYKCLVPIGDPLEEPRTELYRRKKKKTFKNRTRHLFFFCPPLFSDVNTSSHENKQSDGGG